MILLYRKKKILRRKFIIIKIGAFETNLVPSSAVKKRRKAHGLFINGGKKGKVGVKKVTSQQRAGGRDLQFNTVQSVHGLREPGF